jgi:hypothetical protein
MKCLECGSANMKARVTLDYDVPLSEAKAKAGSIKIANLVVSKVDLRNAWEALTVRPIFCHDCMVEHEFVVGEGLRVKG